MFGQERGRKEKSKPFPPPIFEILHKKADSQMPEKWSQQVQLREADVGATAPPPPPALRSGGTAPGSGSRAAPAMGRMWTGSRKAR